MKEETSICPICSSQIGEIILSLDCGNLDHSTLFPTVRLKICSSCGHAFDVLSDNEKKGLIHYYHAEYAPANVSAAGISGDRPGSEDNLTTARYSKLYNILLPFLKKESEILDVGCAMGGFLLSLRNRGHERLCGVEMTDAYVQQAKKSGLFRIEKGEAEALPFKNNCFDVVVVEQVMEHLFYPARAFQEAKRVLRKGGIFFVGVPDAARYSDFEYFDFYWFLLREHIQHFDAEHLRILGEQNGFEMISYSQFSHPVMGPSMVMPDVYTVFRLRDHSVPLPSTVSEKQSLRLQLEKYIRQEAAKKGAKKETIFRLAQSRRPVYIWGIGREFLYLYESCGLKHCNIAALIDRNPLKQKTVSVRNMKIVDETVLTKATADSVLIISAFAHTDAIIKAVQKLNYPGERLVLI